MTNLLDISIGLSQESDGIWYSKENADISCPADGNELSSGLENASFWFNHRNECIDALVQRYPALPGGALFDIGGGNGYVAKALANSGNDVVLVEPGLFGARAAAERGVRSIVCSTLQDAKYAPGTLPAAGLSRYHRTVR